MKIHPVGANLSARTDGQTNTTKLIAEFLQFCEHAEKLHANFHAFLCLLAVQDCKSSNVA